MSLHSTPLSDDHRQRGATLVEFAGYEMPMSYNQFSGGIRKEHLLVRSKSGIFDVSHMGEFLVQGKAAAKFLDYATTRSASELKAGRAQYCLLLQQDGGIIDDIIIYKNSDEDFLMVVNAANRQKDWNHLSGLAEEFEVTLSDISDQTALIAIQGPEAKEIFGNILSESTDLKYYSFLKSKTWTVARTGYTGEDGFEVFLPHSEAPELWKKLIEAGSKPIGLGARDTLRMEVGFALYGHELRENLLPSETLASFAVAKNGGFLGAKSLKSHCRRYQPLALLADSPKPFREGEKLFLGDQEVGHITSGSTSPCLKKGMALALLNLEKAAQKGLQELAEGTTFLLESGPKDRQAVFTKLPFVETERVKKRKPK